MGYIYYCSNSSAEDASEEKKKWSKAILKHLRSELIYDIKNYAFVSGDVLGSDTEQARHYIKDIGEDGNIDRVSRILNLAHAECVEFLYPYSKEGYDKDALDRLDDKLSQPEEYVMTLTLPDGFSKTTVNLLEQLIHEYMICRVLQDWLSIVFPSLAQTWTDKLTYITGKIRSALMSRIGKIRRPLKPF